MTNFVAFVSRAFQRLFQKRNAALLAVLAIELGCLLGYVVFQHRNVAPAAADYGATAISALCDEASCGETGCSVSGYTGAFATTPWLNLRPGSYRATVYYSRSEGGNCAFTENDASRIATDLAVLPAGSGSITFDFWTDAYLPQAQLRFLSDGGSLAVTEAFISPTGAYARVRVLEWAVLLLLADLLGLLWLGKLHLPGKDIHTRWLMVAFVGIVLVASIPCFANILYLGHDIDGHLARIDGLKDAWAAGQFPARLFPSLLQGMGYPNGILYGDVLLWFPALLRLWGFSLTTSYQFLMMGLNLLTAGISYACFKRMLHSRLFGMIGCGLYTLSCFRLVSLYIRSAIGEVSAVAFFPLIVYGLWNVYTRDPAEKDRWKYAWLPAAVGYTGVILSHTLSCLMVGIFTLLACLLLLTRTLQKQRFFALCKIVGVTAIWSLWFLVPMLDYLLRGACSLPGADGTDFHLYDYVITPFSELIPFVRYDSFLSVGPALAAGLALFVLCAVDPAVRLPHPKAWRRCCLFIALGLFSLWVCTYAFPYSGLEHWLPALYALLSPLGIAWRFLEPASLFLSVGTLFALWLMWQKRRKLAQAALACLAACLLLSAGSLYFSMAPDMPFAQPQSLTGLDSQIASGEFLPAGLNLHSYMGDYPAMEGEVTLEGAEQQKGISSFRVAAGAAGGSVVTNLLFYPGYTAADDNGNAVAVSNENGHVKLAIAPAFAGAVQVRFTGMWYWRISDCLSLLALVFTAFLGWRRAVRHDAHDAKKQPAGARF